MDALGFTVWLTNAGTHKIDGPTLKPFSMVQVKDKLKEACLFFQKNVPSSRLNVNSFEKEKLTWRFCSAAKALSSFD